MEEEAMSRTVGDSEPGLRSRLYRIPSRGILFGVCAGIADYFGFDLTVTRVLVVIAAFFSFPLIIVAYLIMALLLPRKGPAERGHGEPVDPVRRNVRSEPHEMLSNVRYRFRDLDLRLQRLEKYVTSNRFTLDREFERLRDKT
jgi:phage shock protein C